MSSLPDDVSIQVSRIDAAFYDKLSAFFHTSPISSYHKNARR